MAAGAGFQGHDSQKYYLAAIGAAAIFEYERNTGDEQNHGHAHKSHLNIGVLGSKQAEGAAHSSSYKQDSESVPSVYEVVFIFFHSVFFLSIFMKYPPCPNTCSQTERYGFFCPPNCPPEAVQSFEP